MISSVTHGVMSITASLAWQEIIHQIEVQELVEEVEFFLKRKTAATMACANVGTYMSLERSILTVLKSGGPWAWSMISTCAKLPVVAHIHSQLDCI